MTLFEACSILNMGTLASQADVKDAYRRLARLVHPDRNRENEDGAEQLKEMNAAYEMLCHHDDEVSKFLQPRDCEPMSKGFADDSPDEIGKGQLAHSSLGNATYQ